MSKYFWLFIIGGFETNNIPYSITCIKIVIIVEEDVFRSIDFAKSDHLDITQTIIKLRKVMLILPPWPEPPEEGKKLEKHKL